MLEVPSSPTQPSGPRVAVVHNPYSFHAYDMVLVPESPSAESTPCSTPCGTSSRAASPADFDATSGSISPFDYSTPGFNDPTQRQSGSHSPPALLPTSAAGTAGKAVPLQWRRYGIRVSHTQALKDLQTFTHQHPVLEKPRVVWVGPRLPTSGPRKTGPLPRLPLPRRTNFQPRLAAPLPLNDQEDFL
eukprot:EG_transcript_5406